MARKSAHAPLDVLLNGRKVGQLRRETSGAIDFRYDPAWLTFVTGRSFQELQCSLVSRWRIQADADL